MSSAAHSCGTVGGGDDELNANQACWAKQITATVYTHTVCSYLKCLGIFYVILRYLAV